jgi:hypothetical protein
MPAMESLAGGNIGRDRFMAFEAETRLLRSVERIVTGSAIVLDVGVSFDDRPRHDQGFERRCGHRPRCEQ